MDDELVPESPIHVDQMGHSSPVMDSALKSNLEVTRNPDGSVETSKVDTPINAGITMNISHIDENVLMGEGISYTAAQDNQSLVVSSTFETPLVETIVSLPPFILPTLTKSPPSTHSPTFDNIMQQSIASLFPSQSTEGPKIVNDDQADDVIGIDVDVMLKSYEHHLQESLDRIDKNNELRVKVEYENFNGAIRALKDAAKEQHVLYVQDFKAIHRM
ncbi:unnamed protein product [Lactuca saligna]|uniref:Uncharacterized protein n=1 Tax=Lactuca saligna TaxID=75948 RepID=A0AA36A2A1_LACSI|nr:unnamed protein product [Lactuca saligna]